MRIIGGSHKGKRIIAPKNIKARPTTDFAKESLFNVLNNRLDFDDLKVLDLFTGIGSIAIEFASRGSNVTAVDIDRKSTAFIDKTSDQLALNISTRIADAFKFLPHCAYAFDLIFADPPYELEDTRKIPNLVFENKLVKQDGWLILEHDEFKNFSAHSNFIEHRKYGKVNFSFFQNLDQ